MNKKTIIAIVLAIVFAIVLAYYLFYKKPKKISNTVLQNDDIYMPTVTISPFEDWRNRTPSQNMSYTNENNFINNS